MIFDSLSLDIKLTGYAVCNWTNDAMYCLLSFHAICHVEIWHAAVARADPEEKIESRWNPNRATYRQQSEMRRQKK